MFRNYFLAGLVITLSGDGSADILASKGYVTGLVANAESRIGSNIVTQIGAAISNVTPAQIGAATSAQGALADTALQVESDPVALAAMATQRIERVWSSDRSQFMDGMGVMWQATQVAYYTVALSFDFEETATHTRPVWTTNAFPFSDSGFSGLTNSPPWIEISGANDSWWGAQSSLGYPLTLESDGPEGAGTAVVSQHIVTVYAPIKTYAAQSDLTAVSNQTVAVQTDFANHLATNLSATAAALNPRSFTVYGDLAATNVSGFAAFALTNASAATVTLARSNAAETNTAWISYAVTGLVTDVKTVVYASANTGTNRYGIVTLWLYDAAGAPVASNTAALPVLRSTSGAAAWFTNELSFAGQAYAPVTSGTVRVSVTLGNPAIFGAMTANSGGSSPLTMELSTAPLDYETRARYAKKLDASGGMASDLTINGTLTLNGITYANIPSGLSSAALTVYASVITSAATVVVVPSQTVYSVTLNTAAVISNDLSRLTVAENIAQWMEYVNFATTNALLSTWGTNTVWAGGVPTLTVTGTYVYTCSTLDGTTVIRKQTFPTLHQPGAISFVNGTTIGAEEVPPVLQSIRYGLAFCTNNIGCLVGQYRGSKIYLRVNMLYLSTALNPAPYSGLLYMYNTSAPVTFAMSLLEDGYSLGGVVDCTAFDNSYRTIALVKVAGESYAPTVLGVTARILNELELAHVNAGGTLVR